MGAGAVACWKNTSIDGVAFGLIGVALASPLSAVFMVLIAMLYVQDVLEDQVKLLGKQE